MRSPSRTKGLVLVLSCLALVAIARAETLIAQAKIAEVTDRGYILIIGTEPLGVEDTPETLYWRGKSLTERKVFAPGDAVWARIKTDSDPPVLREIADRDTWTWLDGVRKNPRRGIVERVDARYLTLKLEDGSTFQYRATDKSAVRLKGKPAGLSDLSVGMKVSVQGRTLANLETWAAVVTDEVLQPKTSPAKKPAKKDLLAPLPASGTIEGRVLGHFVNLKMFDIVMGVRTLHITYNSQTTFLLGGKKASPRDLQKDLNCRIHYRRDRTGRILAFKVELWR
ncbi:MAG TPA: hypothetical protein VM328_07300 [Fimbriimonadaceae bacterium]|nr:hypothetical protein [Fimbriimonadaceae bacterium]